MKTQQHPIARDKRSYREGILASCIAFAATLAALPGHAVDVPSLPLQSGSAYPPANVRFILDDSGSMNLVAMPAALADPRYDNGTGASGNLDPANVTHASYGHNTIYYNPATTYHPWIKADGTRYTGGRTYSAAYRHTALLADAVNLGSSTQTFYVPKAGASATSTSNSDYYRYQIRTVAGELRVVRAEWRNNGNANSDGSTENRGCGSSGATWRSCTFATPTGRSDADEMANFATWYSYHRSRMKVAKAGASEALSQVGDNLRIGLDTINRNTDGIPFDIPVGTDNGLFKGSNKTTWYELLHAAEGDNSTPLHRALQRAGNYFSQAGNSGPWGPESSNQISCRQNFAILTTDGFWNSTSGFNSVGDADGTAGGAITNSAGKTYAYKVERPYYDNFVETNARTRGDTLADVAMHYWKRDLREDLENNVPDSFADPAFWQHMVTFGVSIGLKGRLNPNTDLPAIANGTKHWPDPINGGENADRIDDLWHASVNGRGDFLVASNTREFAQGLLEAFAIVAQRLGSASNVTANSTSFSSDTRVYQASYVSGKWSGELAAYDATSAGVALMPAWKASVQIPVSGRTILTWNGTGGAAFPTAAQVSQLDASDRITSPVNGADNAAYLMGVRSQERQNGGELRDRATVLGDIVNSSPMYVKESETIFVGANDGMLHAFDALSGAELFAYVPGGINFSDLKSLSDTQYSHRYFVDGPVVVSTSKQTPGRNYLVGTLGRGGKGLYGLDVTDPSRFRNSDVLWEMTSGNNLGYVLGEPLIVTLNDGTRAVVFGNGVNSTSGKAVLYVVDIATGVVIEEIDTGVGGDNGLFAPRGWDDDGNGTVDYIYAGDLRGNLWKFDFATSNPQVALGGKPLFTTPTGQPITAGLALAREPAPAGRRWVFVGTGSFMTSADITDATVQSIYGLIDDGTDVRKSDLQMRDIVATAMVNGRFQRAFEPASSLPADRKGWYLDLDTPEPGERVVSRPQVRGNVLLFSSLIPPTNDTCEAGGKGFVNAIDVFTGTGLLEPYFDANGDGVVNDEDSLTEDGHRLPVGSMDLGVGMPTLPTIIDNLLVVGGSKGNMGQTVVNPQGGQAQRISWREILGD